MSASHRHWDELLSARAEEDEYSNGRYNSRLPLHHMREDSGLSGAEEIARRPEFKERGDGLRDQFPRRAESHHRDVDRSRTTTRWYLSNYYASSLHVAPHSPEAQGTAPDDNRDHEFRHTDDPKYYRDTNLHPVRMARVVAQPSQLPSLFGRQGFSRVPSRDPVRPHHEAAVVPAIQVMRKRMPRAHCQYEAGSPSSSESDSYPVASFPVAIKLERRESPLPIDSIGQSQADRKQKRKARFCKIPDCDKLVVDHGVCIRHGGGKRCSVDGCDCRAQNRGLCWKHGGYMICKVEACGKRAKSRGVCWSHGGGTRCRAEDCSKIAVSRGHCWAHGGGKRCKIPECQKPAALRLNNFCSEHHTQFYRNAQPPSQPALLRFHK